MAEIAAELGLPIPTVQRHYASAFELITGHPYSPELWLRLVGGMKLPEFMGNALPRVSGSRPYTSRTRHPVPETTLWVPNERTSGPVELVAADSSDPDMNALVEDIRTLIANGKTDVEIVEELFPDHTAMASAVAWLRARYVEMSSNTDSP